MDDQFSRTIGLIDKAVNDLNTEIQKHTSARASAEEFVETLKIMNEEIGKIASQIHELMGTISNSLNLATANTLSLVESFESTSQTNLEEIKTLTAANITSIQEKTDAVLDSLERLQITSLLNEMANIEERMTSLFQINQNDLSESMNHQSSLVIGQLEQASVSLQDLETRISALVASNEKSLQDLLGDIRTQLSSEITSTRKSISMRYWLIAITLGVLLFFAGLYVGALYRPL